MPAGVLTAEAVEAVEAALKKATEALLAERNQRGFWEGELSSSALSTATAITALAIALKHGSIFPSTIHDPRSSIRSGLHWLEGHQNADGGWGDTTKSLSNISTTTLCWAAFGAADADETFVGTVGKARSWLARQSVPPASRRAPIRDRNSAITKSHASEPGGTPGALFADELARAIIARYGRDRTFSVPILTMCALAGRLGSGRGAWQHVIPLPFELAACPHQLFAALRLPVVSYALPALIAIGQARHVHAPSRNPLVRMIRSATRKKTLRKLTEIQPGNGGFLEATPLTSFVTMSLAASGQQNHLVTQKGLEFLLKSQRSDGSWPIDTNLSTWCTTLAIDALPQMEGRVLEGQVPRVPDPARAGLDAEKSIEDSQISSLQLVAWLLGQQYTREHPYTHAAPGGWAWTDLPGGVPDADDTAGALVALHKMWSAGCGVRREDITRAAESGIRWLLDLQNRDGGIPTFCRGWGALPFDQSSADITAHAMRAWVTWSPHVAPGLRRRLGTATRRATEFLGRTQREDGSFAPLWFGNQFASDEGNRTYGTSRVLEGLSAARNAVDFSFETASLSDGCVRWLVNAQNQDGGWGGDKGIDSSVEETALAVEALATARSPGSGCAEAIERGVNWLMAQVESGAWCEPSPIGFYFAKLWYYERLYPMIFTVGALNAVAAFQLEKEERRS